MTAILRAYSRLFGLLLVLLGVLDALVLPVIGLTTPIDAHLDTAAMYIGFALLVAGR